MDPILGTITIFAGTFPPRGWAFCDGSLQSIAENTALFSIIGTTYGGDGQVTFALPDLRGRAPISVGNGPGLNPVALGEMAGTQTNSLMPANLPPAQVIIKASSGEGTSPEPANNVMAVSKSEDSIYAAASTANATMAPGSVIGGSAPINNMSPYLGIYYIIATEGVYSQRP